MSHEHSHSVAKSARSFLSGTLLSRSSGFFREMTTAFCFGAHPALAAFLVAFRFSTLLRRLFGEGTLSSTFIPHFESARAESPRKGAELFRDLFFSLSALLIGLVVVLEIGLLGFLYWGHLSSDSAQILTFTLLMLPGLLFICLFALSSALLQCDKKFFLTGFAPVAFNIVWIVAAWLLKDSDLTQAMGWLSVAVVGGFLLQWLLTAPHTFRFLLRALSLRDCFRAKLFSSDLRHMLAPFFLSMVGVGAVQINSALDALFARFASLEGPAYLWYAIRLEQLPLALFGIALSSALLPSLSRAIKAGDMAHYHHLLNFALGRSFSLIFPCSMGLFALGVAGVNLTYGRGDFDASATLETVLCLWGYGIGLLPSVFVLLLAPAFYAQKDYRTPTIAAILSVLLNVGLNALMVFGFHWGAFSVAVATSLAAFLNSQFLSYKLSQKIGPIFQPELFRSFAKTALCTLIATGATLFLGHFLTADPTLAIASGETLVVFPRTWTEQLLQFFVLSGTFLLMLFSYAWLLGAQDLLNLLGLKRASARLSL